MMMMVVAVVVVVLKNFISIKFREACALHMATNGREQKGERERKRKEKNSGPNEHHHTAVEYN